MKTVIPIPMLISLQYASDHIRRDTVADNADVTRKIQAASSAIVKYLGMDFFADSSGFIPEDSSGIALYVPDNVQLATAVLVEFYYAGAYNKPGWQVPEQYGYGYLPQPVIDLIYIDRGPVVA
jgi:hypothetical protein